MLRTKHNTHFLIYYPISPELLEWHWQYMLKALSSRFIVNLKRFFCQKENLDPLTSVFKTFLKVP